MLREATARPLRAIGIAILLVAWMSGCSGPAVFADGRLQQPTGDGGGFGAGFVGVNSPVTVYAGEVCAIDRPAVVTGVRLNRAHGMAAVDWAARPTHFGTQAEVPGYASRLGLGNSQRPITGVCSKHGYEEFYVTVQRTGPEFGSAHDVTILTTSGSIVLPFGISLCPKVCTRAMMDAQQ